MVQLFGRLAITILLVAAPFGARAQQTSAEPLPDLPGLTEYAPAKPGGRVADGVESGIRLSARLTESSPELKGGLVWRIFSPNPAADGKLPVVATAQGGSVEFAIEPGQYLVHAAFGRAGATKRITIGKGVSNDLLVLDAGGIRLGAAAPDGKPIASSQLRFSVYDSEEDRNGDRRLIIPDVPADAIIRLHAGNYHIVSNYGNANATIRADLVVEAGKLTNAVLQHRAAEVTLKLAREAGGEALADTSWAVLTSAGDTVREFAGAFASLVLSEGQYTVVARNRDKLYQRDFEVTAGRNETFEVLASEASGVQPDTSTPVPVSD
ncbi:MAG: hypothetical protein WAT70_11590 [Rhizobiaceae bacterium]